MNSAVNEQEVDVVRVQSSRAGGSLGHLFEHEQMIRVRGGDSPGVWRAPNEGLPRLHLLVMDEDAEVRRACVEIGRRLGFEVSETAQVSLAQETVKRQKVDVLLLDLKAPGAGGARHEMLSGGMSLLEEVETHHPDTSVIAMTTATTVTSAVETMRRGAEDYLTKPFALSELAIKLERASLRTHGDAEKRALRERLRSQRRSGALIGNSPVMEKLYRILSKVAHSTHPVLILGESGTGKELVARTIHFNGAQAEKRFIPVDCGAVASRLLEAELFGYVSGAYPGGSEGAYSQGKDGLLVSANGGTVFLNEVDELPLELQTKLLRALQEKVVHPLGGTHAVPMAARVLASSRADLNAMVEQGKFRRDLYFRLSIVTLRIPALRERREDIPELAQYFIEKAPRVNGVAYTLSDEVLRGLIAYDWPGNVRELEISIERVCAMSSGPVLRVVDLPSPLREVIAQMQAEVAPVKAPRELAPGWNPENIQSIAEMERQAILETIRQLDGDKLLAAKLLGIGKTTLYRKLKEYGIQEWDGVN